ncbi:hypothetical protein NDU88_005072 [Pleurodeles waltl]|uniref:Secreted peptide n=1 Tax=Pleurodeles waltl TaxID=8319 RepID=A0AAV7VI05_PLEWA|nr:hypothetical protein NDU88_005072 [Pleurodeles waltl]
MFYTSRLWLHVTILFHPLAAVASCDANVQLIAAILDGPGLPGPSPSDPGSLDLVLLVIVVRVILVLTVLDLLVVPQVVALLALVL